MKTIRVTAKDIERGRPVDVDSCPIALAMRRATKMKWRVSRVELWYRKRSIDTTIAVNRWIRRFDAGLEVKPFSFKVNL